MKNSRRLFTLSLLLAGACVSILAIRAFAQTATSGNTYTLTVKDAKLKSTYKDSPNDFKNALDGAGAGYSCTHTDSNHKPTPLSKAASSASASGPVSNTHPASSWIRVANSPTPSTGGNKITGVNVTQTVTTTSISGMKQVLDTFEGP
jgi:hypothetical protein